MTRGLPSIDVPIHERDPRPCKACKHSFYDSRDDGLQYLRCSYSQYSERCLYQRHETGDCGPDGKHWKARGA